MVDDNYRKSEESVLAVRSIFTTKNGFISREELPDYGVDLDIELIDNNSTASSKKFAVQIKSSKSLKSVEVKGINYISFNFKTSRLGYLAKRPPAYGLIILYDEFSKKLYYDFVDEIISLLDQLESRNGWKDQESVNILLRTQELTTLNTEEIHKIFTQRHSNFELIFKLHGNQFNVPVIENSENLEIEGTSINEFSGIELIEKYGGWLFNECEFTTIINNLQLINNKAINNSNEALFIAAITYTQVGDIIESEYYINKILRKLNEYSEGKKAIINFSLIRLSFLKGNVDHKHFLASLQNMPLKALDEENAIIIEINIIWFSFITTINSSEKHVDISKKLDDLILKIEGFKLDITKEYLLKTYVYEIKYMFHLNEGINAYMGVKIKEGLGIVIPTAYRISQVKTFYDNINLCINELHKAYKCGDEKKHGLLKAMASQSLSKCFYSQRIMFYSAGDQTPESENIENTFNININLSIIAYNEFFKIGLIQNGYESLITALNLSDIFNTIFNKHINIGDISYEQALIIANDIKEKYDFPLYVPSISEIKTPNADSSLLTVSNESLRGFAKIIQENYGLPQERSEIIFNVLMMRKIFEQNCKNPEIELLEDLRHYESPQSHYATIPNHILKHTALGIESKPNTDIYKLLEEFSTILESKTDI